MEVMMKKNFDPKFKARVALEAIKGEKTIAEISSEYSVHPTQISSWKKELLNRAGEVFSKPDASAREEQQVLVDKLHRAIGELKVENDWFKKKLEKFI